MKTKLILWLLCASTALWATGGCSAATPAAPGDFPRDVTVAEGSVFAWVLGDTTKVPWVTYLPGSTFTMDWSPGNPFTVEGKPILPTGEAPTFTASELKSLYSEVPRIQELLAQHSGLDETARWNNAVSLWQKESMAMFRKIQDDYAVKVKDGKSFDLGLALSCVETLGGNPLVENTFVKKVDVNKNIIIIEVKRRGVPEPSFIQLPPMSERTTATWEMTLESARSLANIIARVEKPGWSVRLLNGNPMIDGTINGR